MNGGTFDATSYFISDILDGETLTINAGESKNGAVNVGYFEKITDYLSDTSADGSITVTVNGN